MNTDQERVSAIIGSIYDASTAPTLWPKVMKEISALVTFTQYQLLVVDLSKSEIAYGAGSMSPEAKESLPDYHSINPLPKRSAHREHTGSILRSTEVWPEEEMVRSAFYNEYMHRHDMHHLLNLSLFREESLLVPLVLMRPKSTANFGEQEVRLMACLMPHLQRAIKINRAMSGFETEQAIFSNILDRLPQGVVVIGESGRATFVNRAASLILDQRDGLTLNKQGQLEAADSSETNHLRRSVRTALDPKSDNGLHRGGAIQITRPSGLRPISALITSLHEQVSLHDLKKPAALIFLSDPERHTETTERVLRKLYDLTPAEARLTAILTQGKGVIDACAELEVTSNTARTHLKRVFQKTGARRQSDLVKIVMNGPATLG
jgi:DNA-binding CsgD family transcriptional regulator/PAS domain-containing protein